MIEFEWQDRVDGEDYQTADDINYVANKLGEVVDAQNESKPLETPDWNENDETSKAYIKNRTHYDVTRGEMKTYDCNERNIIPSIGANGEDAAEFHYNVQEYVLEAGKTYEVILFGNTYVGTTVPVAFNVELWLYNHGGWDWAYLSNREYSTGEISLVVNMANPDSIYPSQAESILTITPIEGELQQLDTKFIPDYVSKTYVDEMKCDKTEIKGYVDNALSEAKESGEFDGEDGYTPVRGADYWTEADKAEIKSYVDEAILGGAW